MSHEHNVLHYYYERRFLSDSRHTSFLFICQFNSHCMWLFAWFGSCKHSGEKNEARCAVSLSDKRKQFSMRTFDVKKSWGKKVLQFYFEASISTKKKHLGIISEIIPCRRYFAISYFWSENQKLIFSSGYIERSSHLLNQIHSLRLEIYFKSKLCSWKTKNTCSSSLRRTMNNDAFLVEFKSRKTSLVCPDEQKQSKMCIKNI